MQLSDLVPHVKVCTRVCYAIHPYVHAESPSVLQETYLDCGCKLFNTEIDTLSGAPRARRPCCGNATMYRDLKLSNPPLSEEWKMTHRSDAFQRVGRKANHLCSFAVASPSASGVRDCNNMRIRAKGVHYQAVDASSKNSFRRLQLEVHNVFVSVLYKIF
jgi:hypothetical protein